MDNKEYLKRLFSERAVIRAVIIILAACILSFLSAKLLTGQTAQSAGQVGCALIMFSQLLTVGKAAARISNELEAEAEEERRKQKAGKKKKK